MKIWIRGCLVGLAIIFIVLQLVPVEKLEVVLENPEDIHNQVVIKSDVSNLLRSACYDCHSNETVYPWYAQVAPVSWWLLDHIAEGKNHLNFSEWGTYDAKKQAHQLDDIAYEVEKGRMPLPSYTWVHGEARLSQEQIHELVAWAESYKKKLEE